MIILGLAAVLFFALIFALYTWIRRSAVETEERMKTSFQSLSYEIMERSSRTFLDLARSTFERAQEGARADLELKQKSLESLITPLRETMKSLEDHQRDLEKRREGAYASIFQQIEGMMQIEKDLRKETAQLSMALRAPPVRGAWGQVHLRRVVELAGLLNKCDFTEQTSHESDGRLLRPDLVVHLPGERHIIVDAKTPLIAYFEAQESENDTARSAKLEVHASQLRKHMKELSQKDYWKRYDLSPEFVVLFLPAESFFSAALQVDPTLIEAGAEQNVIVASRLRSILRSLEAAEERMAKMEVLLKMMELESLMRADPGHYDAVFGVYKTAFLPPIIPSAELEGEQGKLFWAEWRFFTNASHEIADYLVGLSIRLGIDYQRFSEPYKGSAKPQYPVSGNEAIWVKWRSSQ